MSYDLHVTLFVTQIVNCVITQIVTVLCGRIQLQRCFMTRFARAHPKPNDERVGDMVVLLYQDRIYRVFFLITTIQKISSVDHLIVSPHTSG